MDYKAKYLKYKNKYSALQESGCTTKECKIIMLKEGGFSNEDANVISDKFNYTQIKIAVVIKKRGFNSNYAYKKVKVLNDSQIKNVFDLINALFDIISSVHAAKKLNPQQVQNAIDLKKAGFMNDLSYDNIDSLTDDIITFSEIFNLAAIEKELFDNNLEGDNDTLNFSIINAVQYLNGDKTTGQIKSLIDLIKAKFRSDNAYRLAKKITGNITNEQINIAINLGKTTHLSLDTIFIGISNNISDINQLTALDFVLESTIPPHTFDELKHVLANDAPNYVKNLTPKEIHIILAMRKNGLTFDKNIVEKYSKVEYNNMPAFLKSTK
jgi:hypothetical protein